LGGKERSDANGNGVDRPPCRLAREEQNMKRMTFSEKKEAWWEWHNANPAVWDYFEKFSLDAVRRGTKKISHWLIINRIRWEVYIVTTGKDFKISNDFIAFYARLWKLRYPQHRELFNTKRMLGEYSIGEYVDERAEETQ
jgi:hypothetical protein